MYDAAKEAQLAQWSTPAYVATGWHPAQEVSLEGHSIHDEANARTNMPPVDDYSQLQLVGQYGPTVQPVAELTAQSVAEVRPGVFVYDMGQNMVGVPRISLAGMKPGQRLVALRGGEVPRPARV